MKKLLGLTLTCIMLLMLVGCGDEVVLDAPDVTYTVSAADEGGTLELEWVAIADADGYYIYADGALVETIEDPSIVMYDATTPAAEYGVSAYAGEDESDITLIDCAPVVTLNLDIYGLSDPDTLHPSGLSFTSSGSATAISVRSVNYPDLDYIFDDDNFPSMTLASPNAYTPVYNSEKNMSVEATTTDFDALDIAEAPGNYSTQTTLSGNAVYSFFMDQDDDDWDTDSDYFGKIWVASITGTHAVITVAYQPITGLRWCVTD